MYAFCCKNLDTHKVEVLRHNRDYTLWLGLAVGTLGFSLPSPSAQDGKLNELDSRLLERELVMG